MAEPHNRAASERNTPIDTVFPALVALRWVHFVSMAVVFGAALFWLAATTPAAWPGAWRLTRRLLRVAAVFAALSGLGWEAAIVAGMADDATSLLDPTYLRSILASPFGPVLVGRLVLLAALLAIVVGLRDDASRRKTIARRLVPVAATAGLLLASQARLGHAAGAGTTPTGLAMMLAYVCHVLAAAAWVGGLPPLLLVLREARGAAATPTLLLLRRVSSLATGAVVVLVLAGTANAAFRLDDPGELATSPYGRVLLAKLGLTAAMLALAAWNRRAVTKARASVLPASVAGELALGLLVLGAAAVLGVTPPPR